jgi:hypothetical protein
MNLIERYTSEIDRTDFHWSGNEPGRRDAALLRLTSSADQNAYYLDRYCDRPADAVFVCWG